MLFQIKKTTPMNLEVLKNVKCRHNCRSSPVVIVYAPDGCNCFTDPIQALCMQHLTKIHSTGPVKILEDLTLDKVFSNEEALSDFVSFDNSSSSP